MKKLIAILISLTMAAAGIAGCSHETPGTNDDTTTSAETSSQDETTAAADIDEEVSEWPKTIIDGAGNEIVLESKPENVTLLHVVYLEYFLALDFPPTAAALGNAQGDVEPLENSELLSPYLKGLDMKNLGSSANLSIEAVLETDPDVIVTFYNSAGLDNYEELSAIAPVIQINYYDSWEDQLRLVASIAGLEDKAEEIIKETEAHVAEVKESLSSYSDKTFALFRTDGKSFIGQGFSQYYSLLGLTKPEGFGDEMLKVSLETVAQMNPDYIVFQHNYDVAKAFVDTMADNSVWNSLEAVKNGHVYYFDENMNSYGPLSINLGADKILEVYTGN